MKILHITEAFASGTYIYLKNLCDFLIRNRISDNDEIYIIYSSKREGFNLESLKKDFDQRIIFINIDLQKDVNLYKDLKSSLRIAKFIGKINPDVIHLHSSKASVVGRWASFFSFKKHKLFYTPHGYSFLREDISKTKQFLFKSIEKYTQFIFGGTTIACGDTEYEIAKTLGKSVLVRNGINIDSISQHLNPIKNSKLTLGIVGRITAQKSPSLFNEIAKKFPQYNFVWIGDGELRDELTQNNIKVTGWINNPEEIYQHINNLDVFLQTSLWEGLPLALLEGLALKKPIIATNVIGNKDVVEHGVNGFLFTNIDELDEYFLKLEDKTCQQKFAENAYKICNEKFNNKINLAELLNIYLKKN